MNDDDRGTPPFVGESFAKGVRRVARKFANEIVRKHATRYDNAGTFHWDIYRELRASDLLSLGVPKDMGGTDGRTVALVAVLEELARVDVSTAVTYATSIELAGGSFVLGGTPRQRSYWLPKLASGDLIGSYAIAEPNSGSDFRALGTTAVEHEGGWLLEGQKKYVTNFIPELDGVVIIVAKMESATREAPIGAFGIKYNNPGLFASEPYDKMSWRGTTTVDLDLKQCSVPAEALIGEDPDAWEHGVGRVLTLGRLGMASIALGAARGAYDEALQYAHDREQFGKPLIAFQTTRMRLAEFRTDIEAARLMIQRTAAMRDVLFEPGYGIEHAQDQDRELGELYAFNAHMAKLFASGMCARVADGAVQVLGGRGLTSESDAGRILRDQRMFQLGQGTNEIEKLIIARECIREGGYDRRDS